MEEYLRLGCFYLSWALLVGGALMSFVGAVGMIRFPDVFTRMHPAGVIDTGGASLILLGLMVQAAIEYQSILLVVKLAFILFFLLFTSPTATHALAKSALAGRVKPFRGARGG